MPEEVFETPQSVQPTESKSTNWPKIVLVTVLGLALLATAAYAGYWYGTESAKLETQIPETTTPEQSPSTTNTTANWRTYRNEKYAFEFRFPRNYLITEKQEEIHVDAPLSRCDPKIIFNIEEYSELKEVSLVLKVSRGTLDQILEREGGKEYGWNETIFNNKKGYVFYAGAEMITPLTKYLVEIDKQEVLEIEINNFESDDQGKCVPPLNTQTARRVRDQILSTFEFLD